MNPQFRTSLMTIAMIVVAVGLSTFAVVMVTRLAGGPSLAVNQITTNKMSTFDVSGDSKITTIPDQAQVNLGITINQSTVKAAQDQANQVINDVNARLGEMGIEKKDIKTENYSLYPNLDFQTGTQRISGYTVNANLVVTISDFAKVNQAIDMATTAGVNQIGGITFSLSDKKRTEVETEARKEAIDNARQKANELAQLSGMNLGKIVNVYESPMGNDNYPRPVMMDSMMKEGAGGGVPTNVEPGSTTFNYTVTLSYETF